MSVAAPDPALLLEVALGAETDQVATTLEISPRTVAKHLQRVHAKLGVSSRSQAVATAWAAAGYSRGAAPPSPRDRGSLR